HAGAAATREPVSRRAPDLGAHGRRARRAPSADCRALRRAVRARAPPAAVRRRGAAERAVCARRPDRRAGGHSGGSARGRAPATPSAAPLRVLPRRRRGSQPPPDRSVTELLVKRLHDGATLPIRAYEHDAGLDLAACERVEIGPGERAMVGTGLTVAIPAGHA